MSGHPSRRELTRPDLAQLSQVVAAPAPPDVLERRIQALREFAATLQPQPALWTLLGRNKPDSEAGYMEFLRLLSARGGLSYQRIADRTARDPGISTVPRSTAHDVLRRDKLPRREDQLHALLVVLVRATGGTGDDVDKLLNLRASLLSHRDLPVSTVATPETFQAADPWADPMALARAARHLLWTLTAVVVMAMAAAHYLL